MFAPLEHRVENWRVASRYACRAAVQRKGHPVRLHRLNKDEYAVAHQVGAGFWDRDRDPL
jgi:hypothetical protein